MDRCLGFVSAIVYALKGDSVYSNVIGMKAPDPLKTWFCDEILPFEGALTRYIRRNWRRESEVPELRQEIYVLLYERAQKQIPVNSKAYLFMTARNHLINRAKRSQIVSFETVA